MTTALERGWGVSVTPRPFFTPGKDLVPIVRENGWAPGPVWTGAENLASTGVRSPDRPARSQSLYRLPAHIIFWESYLIFATVTKSVRFPSSLHSGSSKHRDYTRKKCQDFISFVCSHTLTTSIYCNCNNWYHSRRLIDIFYQSSVTITYINILIYWLSLFFILSPCMLLSYIV